MLADQWQKVKDLFSRAPKLERAAERDPLHSGSQTEAGTEVMEMAGAAPEGASVLDQPTGSLQGQAAAPARIPRDYYIDRVIGPYKVIRRIGRGGMGSVYLAQRTDSFRKLVAIKLMHAGIDEGQILLRFENERQTLAVLDHPNIVKLLDGGSTSEGLPYLVMEYVAGQPIDVYCQTHNLNISERLGLFRQVCSAVQYSHQNLIIHRDLKPANIFVSENKTVKLLDFGIARLLKPDYLTPSPGLTRTQFQPLTPEYASPEQIKGHPISTASDVYALGVLLFRLLTGRLPYDLHKQTVSELETAICELDPALPSRCLSGNVERQYRRHQFAADLDNIVAVALRKEPQNRYASADQFEQDIRRHLEGQPVSARKPTIAYHFAKFAMRHRKTVIAAGAALVVLAGATTVAVRNASVAKREEMRAVKRFNDLRRLASFVIFNFDDAMRAGPTEARRRLIPEALQYLDHVAAETPADAELQRELARGYIRVGDLQGNLFGPNTGDGAGAAASYRKALSIAGAVRDPESLAAANQRLADILAAEGDRKAALRLYKESLDALRPAELISRIKLLNKMGLVQMQSGDAAGALEVYRRSLALAERENGQRRDSETLRLVAYGKERVGLALTSTGRLPEGIELLEQALNAYSGLSSVDSSVDLQRDVANTYVELGDARLRANRQASATDAYLKGLSLTRRLSAGDSRNTQYLRDEHITLGRLADAALAAGDRNSARSWTQQCLRILRPLVRRPDASVYDLQQFAWVLLTTPFAELRDAEAALDSAVRATEMTNRTDPALLDTLARALSATGDPARAITTEESALKLVSGSSALRDELESNLIRFRSELVAQETRTRKAH